MIPVAYITLRELQQRVRQTLEERFALPVWVSAEISEIKVNTSGHCYLELIEKGDGDAVPRAQARAVIWRSQYQRLAARFEAETGQCLAAGIRLLAKVSVNYHEIYGFSLQILDIDPSYTLGDMERQRQLTIARLQAEGVWEMNRSLGLPAVVQRIAVVSSSKAAGYQDFCNELRKSPYRFCVELFEAAVQGAAAEDSLVEALGRIALREEDFDVAVIIRGGGSVSDLNCFNGYRIANHVAQFPLPVLTGIGHDKDTGVTDMVAHTALKTPTAVAAWLVERMAQVEGWLVTAGLQIAEAARETLHAAEIGLQQCSAALLQQSERLLLEERNRLTRAAEGVQTAPFEFLRREQLRVTAASDLLLSHSVDRVLRRGFAIVRLHGAAVKSVNDLKRGDRLDITLADGSVAADVTAVSKAMNNSQEDNG